jgi:hypothetical protein
MTEKVKRIAETVLEDLMDRGGDCPGPLVLPSFR